MSEIYVTVGRLGRTRGVKGEIYIIPETDFPSRFLEMSEIFVRDRDQWDKIRLDSARVVSGRVVIKLEGIESPEEAARFTNREIGVRKEEIVKLPKGAFWIHDLVGCEVLEEHSGGVLGQITDVEKYPANDVYTIRLTDGKEMVIAAVKQFIKSVDIEARKVIIDRSGLLEP
ncbi:MAG: 16S rRNA processing protein RimM [Candidatus Zixiibacteriota bacterium]|nr:MAG: 16S rRNA processing protein RimM [candidate division Zixibacteria bacterium]